MPFGCAGAALLMVAMLAAVSCAREVVRPEPPAVPADWRTLRSAELGFSLRFPPDWGPRENGEFLPLEKGCPESVPTVTAEGEPQHSYTCQIEPKEARQGPPDPGFYLLVDISHLPAGETMEAALRGPEDREGTKVATAAFAGRRWTVVDAVDPDCCPPTKDYGYCLDPDGSPSRCTTREYLSDHGEELVFTLALWSQSPAEFDRFEDQAERAVRSVTFTSG